MKQQQQQHWKRYQQHNVLKGTERINDENLSNEIQKSVEKKTLNLSKSSWDSVLFLFLAKSEQLFL